MLETEVSSGRSEVQGIFFNLSEKIPSLNGEPVFYFPSARNYFQMKDDTSKRMVVMYPNAIVIIDDVGDIDSMAKKEIPCGFLIQVGGEDLDLDSVRSIKFTEDLSYTQRSLERKFSPKERDEITSWCSDLVRGARKIKQKRIFALDSSEQSPLSQDGWSYADAVVLNRLLYVLDKKQQERRQVL